MKRGKGYSHWNPDVLKDTKLKSETGIPRLFRVKSQAKTAIKMWTNMPNAEVEGYQNNYGEYDNKLKFRDDGRKISDLEVVQIEVFEMVKK